MNHAIIDIGSNTINVLIANVQKDGWSHVAEYKNPARLGKGGIDKNILSPEAIERGLDALKNHVAMAEKHECGNIQAFATAAVRDATNKDEFLSRAETEVGLKINVIEGKREAELIAFGIKASGALNKTMNLILDIGGGSTEFILVENDEIIFKESYRLGVTRLLEKFTPNNPLSQEDLNKINKHIASEISSLVDVINKYQPSRLVGASGSFDSLAQMASQKSNTTFDPIKNNISISDYTDLSKSILETNHESRSKIPGLVPHRVETIPMAILLIDKIIELGSFDDIYQSSYALKEGAIEESLFSK